MNDEQRAFKIRMLREVADMCQDPVCVNLCLREAQELELPPFTVDSVEDERKGE